MAELLELVKWKRGLRGPGLRNDPGAASFLAQPKNRGAYGAGPPIFAQLMSAQGTLPGYYTASLVSLIANGGYPTALATLSPSIAVVNVPEALAQNPSRTLLNGASFPSGNGPLFRCWPLSTINKAAGFTKVTPLYAIEAHDPPVVSFQQASGPLPLTAPILASQSGPFDTIAFVANVQIKYWLTASTASDPDLVAATPGAYFAVAAAYNGTQVAQGACAAISGGIISMTYLTNVSLSGTMVASGKPPFNLDLTVDFIPNGGVSPASYSATGWVTFVLAHTAQF